jgi:hypothetical protein
LIIQVGQIKFLEGKVKSLESEIIHHVNRRNSLSGSPLPIPATSTLSMGDLAPYKESHRAFYNWERKMNFLNVEMRKYQIYLDAIKTGLTDVGGSPLKSQVTADDCLYLTEEIDKHSVDTHSRSATPASTAAKE